MRVATGKLSRPPPFLRKEFPLCSVFVFQASLAARLSTDVFSGFAEDDCDDSKASPSLLSVNSEVTSANAALTVLSHLKKSGMELGSLS